MIEYMRLPKEPPSDLTTFPYDEELFELCRDDDYQGLYKAFILRYGVPLADL